MCFHHAAFIFQRFTARVSSLAWLLDWGSAFHKILYLIVQFYQNFPKKQKNESTDLLWRSHGYGMSPMHFLCPSTYLNHHSQNTNWTKAALMNSIHQNDPSSNSFLQLVCAMHSSSCSTTHSTLRRKKCRDSRHDVTHFTTDYTVDLAKGIYKILSFFRRDTHKGDIRTLCSLNSCSRLLSAKKFLVCFQTLVSSISSWLVL